MINGRNRFVGKDVRNLLRSIDRSILNARPRTVHHVSQLPPARESKSRFVFVAGSTNTMYYSDGTSWNSV